MKILFTSCYKEKNEYRRKELELCLIKNLIVFDKVVLLSEYDFTPITDRFSIVNVKLTSRPTWSDFIRATHKYATEKDLVVVANSDIYFEDLEQFNEIDFANSCLALTRWDTTNSDYEHSVKKNTLYWSFDSQDAWVFKGSIKPVFGEFVFGYSGSDNRIAHELSKAYTIYNPAKDIKCFHLHTTTKGLQGVRVNPPYKQLVITDLNVVPKIKKYGILHIGMRGYEAEYGLCEALKKIGTYDLIEWQKYFNYEKMEDTTIEKRIEFYREVINKSIGKDLVFMHIQMGGVITSAILKLIHEINPSCKIVNFNGDVRREVPKWMYELGNECITIFTNKHDVDEMVLRGYDSSYMNVGFDPTIYKPEGKKVQCAPIVFIGNNYKENTFPMSKFRYDMAHELKKEFGDKFSVYGNGWGELSSGYLNAFDEAAVLRSCKACINVSHFEYPRYSSDRLHRAMGCGSLILCKRFPQMNLDFGYSTSIEWETIKELKSWITTILNPSYGTDINIIGSDFAHKYLTWDYLINQLIRELDTEHKIV